MDAKTPEHLRDEERPARPAGEPDRQDDEREQHRHSTDDDSGRKQGEQDRKEKPKVSWAETLRRHPWWVAAAIAALLIVALIVLLWWLHARQHESTDDAFIDARTVTISAQISGA